jgi:putative membrane protein
MKSILPVALFTVLAAIPGASAQTRANSNDAKFIEKMAGDGTAEVELGKLAEQKSSNPQVKTFAQRLVSDHSKANQQLMSIAQRDSVSPPKSADKEHSALQARLAKLNGQAFDRAFVQAQVEDHQKDIQYLQQQARAVQDPNLKSFIQQTLPVMQQHLQMAEQIENQMTGSGSTVPRRR